MSRVSGTYILPSNFEVTGQMILDARLSVPNIEDLYTAYVSNNYYKKMVVTVENEDAQYMLVDVSKRTLPEGWKKLGSDVEVDTELDVNSNNPVANSAVTKAITDNELVVSAALNDLNDRLSGVSNDISSLDNRVSALEQGGGTDPTTQPSPTPGEAITIQSSDGSVSVNLSGSDYDIKVASVDGGTF